MLSNTKIGYPDYAHSRVIANNTTVTESGFVYATGNTNGVSQLVLQINGANVSTGGINEGGSPVHYESTSFVPVFKGDLVTVNGGANVSILFFPLR